MMLPTISHSSAPAGIPGSTTISISTCRTPRKPTLTERLERVEAGLAKAQRRNRQLLWLLAAMGVVRLLLYVEAWALDTSVDQMIAQAFMLGRG